MGFGFTSHNWEPRRFLAGTYDEAWEKKRSPLLPKDFRREYFSAASAGLVAPGYLGGGEPVRATNVAAEGVLRFELPGLAPPVCLVSLKHGGDERVETRLDTVILNTDERKLILLWRSFLALREGPHDVRAYRITCANAPEPRVKDQPSNVVAFPAATG